MLNFFRHDKGRELQMAAGAASTPAPTTSGSNSSSNGLIDLSDLEPFVVQMARVDGAADVSMYDLTQILTTWMNDSYEYHLKTLDYTSEHFYAAFKTVILLDASQRRLSQQRLLFMDDAEEENWLTVSLLSPPVPLSRSLTADADGQLYTAHFTGAALFTRNTTELEVPTQVVQFIQETTLTNKTGLLQLLKLSTASGLGASVVDLNIYVADDSTSGAVASGTSNNTHLQAIIIVAVVVAAVAFCFLLAAIWWAWRYDQRNREAYLVKNNSRTDPTGTASSTEEEKGIVTPEKVNAPMSEIGGESVTGECVGVYPESVISEDISTSLSQYYRSGLGSTYSSAFAGRAGSVNQLSDAGSVSSIESYGYSLDGYAPSTVAPTVTEVKGQRGKKKTSRSRPPPPPDEEAPEIKR